MTSKSPPADADAQPAGCLAVPIDLAAAPASTPSPAAICLLVRREPDPVAGRFILLRPNPAARAYLACLTDANRNIVDWLELWVESPPSDSAQWLDTQPTNAQSAARWDELANAFAKLGKITGYWASGWEKSHAPPLVLESDAAAGPARIIPLADPTSAERWMLCTDESILSAAGLPGFAASPHRYLYLPSQKQQPSFIPATAGAPPPAKAAPLPAAPTGRQWEPFNLAAGRMLLRRHGPIPIEAMVDVLAARPWRGLRHGTGLVLIGGGVEALRLAGASETDGVPDAGRLFLGRHGRRGRVIESFHLRLKLLADMIAVVRQAVATMGRPLLSLGPESFQLRLPEPGSGLPFLWAAELTLAESGSALRRQIPGSPLRFFHLPADLGQSIYRPLVQPPVVGDAVMRVRKVVADAQNGVVVEGTLSSAERIQPSPAQLLRLHVVLASGAVDLFARLEDAPPAAGEWRFRGVGQRLPGAIAAEFQAAAGVPLQRVPFALIATAGPASDLHALGVLAIQILLADEQTLPLPVALDEMMSLGRQLARQHDPRVGAGLRLRSIAETDPRWQQVVGPHRLVQGLSPQEAADLIPAELWWDTLAAVLRLLPALGPDSICPAWSDPLADAAQHRVFDPALADVQALVRRSRSLILIDWRFNREIRAAIDARLPRAH